MQGDQSFLAFQTTLSQIHYKKMWAVFVLNIKIKLLMEKTLMSATMNNYNTLLDWKKKIKIKGSHSKHQATFESFSSL